MTRPSDGPAGMPVGPAFEPFTAEATPARVVAVHKETSIVRGPDDFDRPAIVSGRFRFDALAPSDYPGRRGLGGARRRPGRGPHGRARRHHRGPPPPVGVRPQRGRREPAVGGPPGR